MIKQKAVFVFFTNSLFEFEKQIKHFFDGWFYSANLYQRSVSGKVLNRREEVYLKNDILIKVLMDQPTEAYLIDQIESGCIDVLDMAYAYRSLFDSYQYLIINAYSSNEKSSSK